MVNVSAETFAKNCIHTIKQLRKGKERVLWIRIKDIGEKLDVKDTGDLIYKEIKGKFETNYLTEQQIRKYKNMDQNLFKAPNLCMLQNPLVPDNFRKYRIKHNPKMNIFLVLNKNHRKYQFTYGIFRHVYYAIFDQCTKSKSKSFTYIHTVKSIKIN